MRTWLCTIAGIGVLLLSRPATASVLQSVSLSQANVTGGTSVAGTVTLDGPAIGGGVVVTLSSNATAATVMPAQVTVPAGATTASFQINTTPVAANPNVVPPGVVAIITATPAAGFGSPKTARLTVLTPMLSAFGVLGPVAGGQNTGGWVELTGPAPAGGIGIKLASNNEAVVKVPATVTIAAGARGQSFQVTTSSVAAPTSVIISASRSALNFKDVTLALIPPSLAVLGCDPHQVNGGTPVTCKVWLDAPAAAKVTVALASSNTAVATVPSSVNLDAGQKIAPFTVTTQQAGAAGAAGTPVTISASYGGETKTNTITVIQAPLLTALGFNPAEVRSGNVSIARVALSAPAPSGGTHVKLTSANPGVAFPVALGSFPPPASANIPIQGGHSSGEIQVVGNLDTGYVDVPFSASYAGVTRTATLRVAAVPALKSVAFSVDNISHIPQSGTTVSATATLTSAPSDYYEHGDDQNIHIGCEYTHNVGCGYGPYSVKVIGRTSVGISVKISHPCPAGSSCKVVLHVKYKGKTKSDTLNVYP
jgi:hypothetical protein